MLRRGHPSRRIFRRSCCRPTERRPTTMAAAVRQASTRLQSLLTRGADVLRSEVAPTVRKSYNELMEKNAGAHVQDRRRPRGVG